MSVELDVCLNRPDFDLEVREMLPAGITAVFGPSGCGKTSLLRVIAGLEPKARGRVVVQGQCWQDRNTNLPPHRRRVGFVFQQPYLYPHLDVRANLQLVRKFRPQVEGPDPEALAERLGLSHLLNRRPEALSGGEKQRVAVARALLGGPELLLMDEPLSALDEMRKADLLPWLRQIQRDSGLPVIYVSHDRREVAYLADHLLLLERGRVLARGPAPALFSDPRRPLAQGPQAEAILQGRVQAWDETYALATVALDAEHRLELPLARARMGDSIRMQVLARDVSLCLSRPKDSSILNVLPAQVESLHENGPARILVRLRLGEQRLLALITRKSAERLSLRPGGRVFAQIKSVAVL